MQGTSAVCLLAWCLVLQPPVTLAMIFENENNSTSKEAPAGNRSSENLFVTLKNRIHRYRDPDKAYDINHPARNILLTLKDKTHRYDDDDITMKTPTTNHSSESPIVTRKNESEETTTASDENQFVESPFVTLKYQDYHARSKGPSKDGVRNSSALSLSHLLFLLQQLRLIDFDRVIQEYLANRLL